MADTRRDHAPICSHIDRGSKLGPVLLTHEVRIKQEYILGIKFKSKKSRNTYSSTSTNM